MKTNKLLFISIFIIFLSTTVMAYGVNIDWTFDKPNYDVELYRCTNNICSNFVNQLLSTVESSNTYHMSYSTTGTQYHAAFFYEQCYRPNGYTITTFSEFSTTLTDQFVKKNLCRSEINPLTVSVTQSGSDSIVTITTDIKSAFTVSDDAPRSPKFYPESHRRFFTSEINVKLLLDDNLVSEQTIPIYQDEKQTVSFNFNKATLSPGKHTAKILTDPIDCICNQNNKILRYRTVEIQVEEPQNTPPVIQGVPDKTIPEDSGYHDELVDLWQYTHDNETPNSGLTFTVVSQTNKEVVDCIIDYNMYVDCATLHNMNGCSDVRVRVADPQGLYDDDTFSVCVQPVNDAPEVGDIPNQTVDSCHEFEQFDLDSYVKDVDNSDSEITWTYSGNTYLSMSINPTTHVVTVTYPQSFRGSETIKFIATDPEGLSDYDYVKFTVTECLQNTPPTIEVPDQTYDEDSGIHIIDLHNYASDNESPDNQLNFTLISQTNTAVVNCVLSTNRYLQCTTQQNMYGYSDITVRVTDPQGLSDEDTFRITVQPVNDAPEVGEIPNQSIDSCHQFTNFDLDKYVEDPDDTDQEITWHVSGNTQLTVAINSNHAVTIGYPAGFIGSETIRFTAKDPHGAQDYDDVTFTVTECPTQNTPPKIGNIPDKWLKKNSGLNKKLVNLWAYTNDGETPDNELTFTILTQTNPEIVSCTIQDNRYVECTVKPNKLGYSDVTVRVTDPEGLHDEDKFRVNVIEGKVEEEPEVEPSIQIMKVVYDDKVKQGGYLHIDIYAQGNKVKNTRATITIQELDINEEFNRLNAIDVEIPEKADIGLYTMQITVKSNKNEEDKVYRQFLVESKDDLTKMSETDNGKTAKITGATSIEQENNNDEATLTIIAIAVTVILVIIVGVIAALTTKKLV